jgi:hypothetical protein
MPSSFSPYQVDYSVKNTSKTFGFSKKRVSFKFGIANPQAITEGLTGANCRGSEHEIIFIWSLNSGKRQILADGKDVHFSESGQNGWTSDQVFQHHFNLKVPNFNHPLRCHLITQPSNKDVPSIKPFDLRINGMPFSSFCKIFQLGTSSMVSRSTSKSKSGGGGGGDDDPYVTPEERKAIAAAKLASIRDMKSQEANRSQGNSNSGNLIDFGSDPTPAPVPVAGASYNAYGSSGSLPPQPGAPPPAAGYPGQAAYSNYSFGAPAPAPAYGQAPPPQPAYGQPAPFGQAPQPPAYGAPAPTYVGYGQPQPGFGSPQSQPAGVAGGGFGSPQSNMTYGSAPTFAMPPPQQQQPPQGYPQQQYPSY